MHLDTKKSKKEALQRSQRKHRSLNLPVFFPDATYAAIHGVPFDYVKEKLSGLVVTTLHMHLLGLEKEFSHFGGYKKFAGLPEDCIILSDSGGFQVLSLINRHGLGQITPDGAKFKNPEDGNSVMLTPELSQNIQHSINSDIRVTLDVPLMGPESEKEITEALEITTKWAVRSKNQFLKNLDLTEAEFEQTKAQRTGKELHFSRPLLNAVVQGGNSVELRKRSGKELSRIGFDLYGFGGWPVDQNGKLMTKVIEAFVESLPSDSLTYGMGIGTPDDIATCHKIGIEIFDCVIPTRNGRHGTLYVTKGTGEKTGETFDVLHIKSAKYQFEDKPIDPECDCPVCKNYSRSYLRFLMKKKNPVGFTLASVHNIWWYLNFMRSL